MTDPKSLEPLVCLIVAASLTPLYASILKDGKSEKEALQETFLSFGTVLIHLIDTFDQLPREGV